MSSQNKYSVIDYLDYYGQQCRINPSQEQLKVILSDLNQDQKIIACAGSGKTTTLVIRLKYLIDKGVNPEQILVTTYNVDAGKNLKKRAKEIIGNQSSKIEIGNIDKVAYKIYQKYIMATSKQQQDLKSSVKEFCNKLYQFLLTPEGYQQVLSKYQYFFFDEFQDVNQLQYDILILFKKAGCNITVIGDDAQNIYGFRDSKLELIQQQIDKDVLKITNKEIHEYHLSLNYRCSKPITEFSNQIIANSKYLIQKEMRYNTQKNYQKSQQPQIKLYKSWDHQVNSIIEQIKQLQETCLLSDIAVLCPTNIQLRFFEEKLEKNNKELINGQIPFIYRSQSIKEFYQGNDDDINDNEPKLTLSTLHQAKGLEWKIVFFIGINDQHFPGEFVNYRTLKVQRLEECRRLFYVGCTRAIQELNFSVLQRKKDDNSPIVCRFFSEIDQKYYIVDKDIQKKDFAQIQGPDNFKQKGLDNQTSITKIIEEFDYRDFEKIDSFLSDVKHLYKEDIHKKPSFDIKQIAKNRLSVDLGIYIDILFQRIIAEKYNSVHGYSYSDADKVLFSINWANQRADVVYKYKLFFENKNINFDQIEDQDEFIDVINMFYIEKSKEPFKLEEREIRVLKEIYGELKLFMTKNNLDYKNVCHQLIEGKNDRVAQFFPDDFDDKKMYIESYKKYCDPKFQTMQILEDIYNVSKCGQLVNLIRRSLYRNDFDLFNPLDLKIIIDRFLDFIKRQNFQTIEVKKKVNDENLIGEVDFIADDTIFEIKSASSYEVQKEYIIQCLAYASLMRKQGQKINSIAFYNPLQGYASFYDISNWNLEKEFCNLLFQISLNKIIEKEQQSQNSTKNPQTNQNGQIVTQEENNHSSDYIEIQNKEIRDDFNTEEYIEQLQDYVKVDKPSSDIQIIEVSEHKVYEQVGANQQQSNEKAYIQVEQSIIISSSDQKNMNQLQYNKCQQDDNQSDFETEQKSQKTHLKMFDLQQDCSETDSSYSCQQNENIQQQPSISNITPIKLIQEIQPEYIIVEDDSNQDLFIYGDNFNQRRLNVLENESQIQQKLIEKQNKEVNQIYDLFAEPSNNKANDESQIINSQYQNNLDEQNSSSSNNDLDQNQKILQSQAIIIESQTNSQQEEIFFGGKNESSIKLFDELSKQSEKAQNKNQNEYQCKNQLEQNSLEFKLDIFQTPQQKANSIFLSEIDLLSQNLQDKSQQISSPGEERQITDLNDEFQKMVSGDQIAIDIQKNQSQEILLENSSEKNKICNYNYNQITFSQLFNKSDPRQDQNVQQESEVNEEFQEVKDWHIQKQQIEKTSFLKQNENYSEQQPFLYQQLSEQNNDEIVIKSQFQNQMIIDNLNMQQSQSNINNERLFNDQLSKANSQSQMEQKQQKEEKYDQNSQNNIDLNQGYNNDQQKVTQSMIFDNNDVNSNNLQNLLQLSGGVLKKQKNHSKNNGKNIKNFKENKNIQKKQNKINYYLDNQKQINNVPQLKHKNKKLPDIQFNQNQINSLQIDQNQNTSQKNNTLSSNQQENSINNFISHKNDSIQFSQNHRFKNDIIDNKNQSEEIVTHQNLDEESNQQKNVDIINLCQKNKDQTLMQSNQNMNNISNISSQKLNSKRKVNEIFNQLGQDFQQETQKKIKIEHNYDISHYQIKTLKDILILLSLIWFTYMLFKNKQLI